MCHCVRQLSLGRSEGIPEPHLLKLSKMHDALLVFINCCRLQRAGFTQNHLSLPSY